MWHPARVPLLLLLGVLAADLAASLWCWSQNGSPPEPGTRFVLLLPQLLYVAVVTAVARDADRRLLAAGLALLSLPMIAVSDVVIEVTAGDTWVEAESPLLRLDALLVGLPLVAAWGVARLRGRWQVGLLAVPATVVVQMVLNHAVANPVWEAAFPGPDGGPAVLPGALWWAWELLPVLLGGLACRWAAERPAPVTPPAS